MDLLLEIEFLLWSYVAYVYLYLVYLCTLLGFQAWFLQAREVYQPLSFWFQYEVKGFPNDVFGMDYCGICVFIDFCLEACHAH